MEIWQVVSMDRIAVKLFGGFEVRVGGGAPIRFPTRKTRALLAFLAARLGQPQPRDKLASLLWGDSSDRVARQSLRQALYEIRRKVVQAGAMDIIVEGDAVALQADAVTVDLPVFESLVALGDAEAWAQAAALYRGDLIEGLTTDQPAFEEWLVTERERLRELLMATLAKLVAHHDRAGALDHAVQFAVSLVALDPLQEPAHRTLMRLYARSGRRAAALRQYQVCAGVLRRDLDADPEPQTRALYHELLRASEPADPPGEPATPMTIEMPPPSLDGAVRGTLIGREAEVGRLRDSLDHAWRESAGVVAVIGEAGVGKSRLVEALATEVTGRGGRVLVGHAREMERTLTLGPWVEALRSSLGRGDAHALQRLPSIWLEPLQRLLPELGGGRPSPSGGDDRPETLFEAVARALEHLASRAPRLVVLEDVHWADEATLRLLSFLAHRLQAAPLLVALTVREEELPEAPLLGQLLRDLDLRRRLSVVPLERLDRASTIALVRTLTGAVNRSRRARLAGRVWRLSEGNPFMVVEMVHAAREMPDPRREGELRLPERVRTLVTARLTRLSEPASRMVGVAAAVAREFGFEVVQRASGMEPAAAADALEELVRRRILRASGEQFVFGHDRIREVAYERLLPLTRRVLHRAIGETLEALAAGQPRDGDDHLAYHFVRAGDADRAVTYLTRAAATARRRYALDATLGLLDEALVHTEALPGGVRERRRLEVLLRKAQILSIFGRFQDVLDLLVPEGPRLETLRDPALEGPYRGRLALTLVQVGRLGEAVGDARRALECATQSADELTLGHAHYVLGVAGFWSGKPGEGAEHAATSAALLERLGEQAIGGLAYWIVGLNRILLGDLAEAMKAEQKAAEIAERSGQAELASRAAWSMAWIALTRGDCEAAIVAAETAIARSPNHPSNRATALSMRGRARLERGDVDGALADLEEAGKSLSAYGTARSLTAAYLGEAHLARGDIDAARTAALAARDSARAIRCPWAEATAQRVLGAVALAAGQREEALTSLREALATFEAMGARVEAARTGALARSF
jgi:DNA-binding SARP family transcriptional activator